MQKLLATSEGFLFFLSALVELIAFVKEAAQTWKWICCTQACYNWFAHWIGAEFSGEKKKKAVAYHCMGKKKGVRA